MSHSDVPQDCVCIGTLRDGEPVGGFVFGGYLVSSIQVHMAGLGGRWCTRDLLILVFDYAFNQLRVHKLIAPVPSTNVLALDMDQRAGFVEEARLQGVVPGGDMVFLTMTRDQCRFLGLQLRGFTPGSNPQDGG